MVNTIIYMTRRIVFIISILFVCHGQHNYLCHTSYCVYNELIIIICMSWSTQLFMSHVVLCL